MLTEREELVDAYSDGYKDLNGFRPRDPWMWTCPIEELRAAVERVYADLRAEIEREREEAEAHRIEVDYQEPSDADEYPLQGEGWCVTLAE